MIKLDYQYKTQICKGEDSRSGKSHGPENRFAMRVEGLSESHRVFGSIGCGCISDSVHPHIPDYIILGFGKDFLSHSWDYQRWGDWKS
jgi:hypothetical protein